MEIDIAEIDENRRQFVFLTNRLIKDIDENVALKKVQRIFTDICLTVTASRDYLEKLKSNYSSCIINQILDDKITQLNTFRLHQEQLNADDLHKTKLMAAEYLSKWYYQHISGSDFELRNLVSDVPNGHWFNRFYLSLLQRFNSISIKRGFPLVLFILLLPSAGLIYKFFVDKNKDLSAYEEMVRISNVYQKVLFSINEIQKERGMSSGIIASRGSLFESELASQRQATDAVIESLFLSLEPHKITNSSFAIELKADNAKAISLKVATIKRIRDQLEMLRYLVDQKNADHLQSIEAYSRIINRLIQFSDGSIKIEAGNSIRTSLATLNTIVHLIESAGIERATGAAGFGKGDFDRILRKNLSFRVAKQDIMLERFKSLSTDTEKALFDVLIDSNIDFELNEFRKLAFDDISYLGDNDISNTWWELSTHRIEQYNGFILQLLSIVTHSAVQTHEHAQAEVHQMTILSLLYLGLIILLALAVQRNVRLPIINVSEAMNKLRKGNYDKLVRGQSQHNEIGELVKAYESFRIKLLRASLADELFTETTISKKLHNIEIKEKIQASESFRQESQKDFLTGCFNRRGFEQYADEVFAKSKGRKDKPSLIMMDIDNFKQINDKFGHDIGDEVIKKVSEIGMSLMRDADLMARVGGEEFAVIMANTSLSEAISIAERMQKSIAKADLLVNDKEVLQFSLSFGVAFADDHVQSVSELLKCADSALYSAKRTGKNKISSYRRQE